MEKAEVDQMLEEVSTLLSDRLGVRGTTLETRVRRAGRSLPAPVRRAAADLIRAEQMAEAPVMLRRLDPAQMEAARDICLRHLGGIDVAASRSKARYGVAASIIVQLCLVMGVTLSVLNWRGFL